MRLMALFLLASVNRAVAQSSVTVSMAWDHGNPWAAYEVGKVSSVPPFPGTSGLMGPYMNQH